MNKILFLWVFFIVSVLPAQDRQYIGTVRLITFENDTLPLSEANVVTKGMAIGVITDADGRFKILVPESRSTLTFSHLDAQSIDYQLGSQQELNIFLVQENEVLCDLRAYQNTIGFQLNSGLLNTPYGGQFYFSLPYLFDGASRLDGSISFQTNSQENRFFITSITLGNLLSLEHMVVDISTSHRNLKFVNAIAMKSYSAVSSLNIYKDECKSDFVLSVITGLGTINYRDIARGFAINTAAPVVGIKKHFGGALNLTAMAKTTFYKNLNEHEVQISRRFGKLHTSLNYYSINGFSELSLGVGFELYPKQ